MVDLCFSHPRLAKIYDAVDGSREDLDLYVSLAEEFAAQRILDLGCGTGSLAIRLAQSGCEVTGLDPAEASLTIAKSKTGADRVRWLHGTLPEIASETLMGAAGVPFDLVVMTGNVAQVFLDDDQWQELLASVATCLRAHGTLAFEVRDPAQQAWQRWTRDRTYQELSDPELGPFRCWCAVDELRGEFVTFTHTYQFLRDSTELKSKSTLRFRSKESILQSLEGAGFAVDSIREAPDRPLQEWVFVAQTRG